MEITLQQLLDAASQFNQLLNAAMPIRAAHKVRRIRHALADEVRACQESLIEIGTRHSAIKNGKLTFDGPNRDEITREYRELMSSEIEIGITPIPVAELGEIMISPESLEFLGFLIDFGDEHGMD